MHLLLHHHGLSHIYFTGKTDLDTTNQHHCNVGWGRGWRKKAAYEVTPAFDGHTFLLNLRESVYLPHNKESKAMNGLARWTCCYPYLLSQRSSLSLDACARRQVCVCIDDELSYDESLLSSSCCCCYYTLSCYTETDPK